MRLWDTLRISTYDFSRTRRLPYCIERDHSKQALPVVETKKYMLIKVWNKCPMKALRLQNILLKTRRYNKVKLHKGCIYATRRFI